MKKMADVKVVNVTFSLRPTAMTVKWLTSTQMSKKKKKKLSIAIRINPKMRQLDHITVMFAEENL